VNLAITKAEELGFVKEKPVAPKHKTLAKKEGDSIEGGQPRTEYNVEDDIHRVPISYINMHL
jgi:hypothetical protein